MKRYGAFVLILALLIGCLSGCGAPTGTGEITPTADGKAYLIDPLYPTDDVVVADFIATDEAFGADPTGEKDSTKAIQKALLTCGKKGGTVWLPAGKYRITGQLVIPAFVTLRGDWQDPDKGTDYGTVLVMDIPSEESESGSIMVGGSAGAVGLTVYYPNQSLDDVKPYPFTFYVSGVGAGFMLQTIKNCTLINAYKGVGACVEEKTPHEMMTLDTIKGTVLSLGAEVYNQSDVGTWKNISFSPKYWAEARGDMNPPAKETLAAYTKEHTTGLKLGDLEWTEFAGLTLSDFAIGIHVVTGKRIQFAGSMYDVNVTDCDTALLADNMDARWGAVIAKGVLSGRRALINRSDGEFRLTGVTLDGETEGAMKIDKTAAEDLPTLPQKTPPKPKANLVVVEAAASTKKDIGDALQKALDTAKAGGGGVVYLPSGLYRLEKPVTVPAGVELRGASSVAQREQYGNRNGTLLLVYPQTVRTDLEADKQTAMITLAGDNAGLRGIRLLYPDNVTALANGEMKVDPSGYAVRGQGKGVYAINVAITGGYNGIDFRGCDDHYIQKFVGCQINNGMTVGGKNGVVEGCLQNGNALCRMNLTSDIVTSVSETMVFDLVFDPVTRLRTEYIRVEKGATETIFNTFAYGVKSLIVSGGESTTAVNVAADNIGPAPLLNVIGGSAKAVNMMRYNGSSYKCARDASVQIYNRLTINGKDDESQSIRENVK